ncbi:MULTISPECIES: TRAP transporter small permease [Anoxynatronum]|uniref:C4-dicarboxylate transporter, DctQ subunit n=2 Tax=Anoxynatronum TaxID=210622 RepID=A0AA45WVY2_9CLOT|nr:TRAP transporter small permease [Anoxynatronum buryatiense]SMP51181.1 C4-dicarboxylate transporter, DctQ subunit [Anoxynatronum buryatiense]
MKNIVNLLNKTEEVIASSLLILTSVLVFVQVVLRYQFNYSLAWSEELARLMIAWFIFLGASMAVKENAHVNMDAAFILLKGKAKIAVGILIDLINIAFCALVVFAGINMVKAAMAINSTATSIDLPLWIFYASVPVGVALMLIRYLFKLKDKIILLAAGEPDAADEKGAS